MGIRGWIFLEAFGIEYSGLDILEAFGVEYSGLDIPEALGAGYPRSTQGWIIQKHSGLNSLGAFRAGYSRSIREGWDCGPAGPQDRARVVTGREYETAGG